MQVQQHAEDTPQPTASWKTLTSVTSPNDGTRTVYPASCNYIKFETTLAVSVVEHC
jgi:hypothetical protein